MAKIKKYNVLSKLDDDEITLLILIGLRAAVEMKPTDSTEFLNQMVAEWELGVDVSPILIRLVAKDMIRHRPADNTWVPSPTGLLAVMMALTVACGLSAIESGDE